MLNWHKISARHNILIFTFLSHQHIQLELLILKIRRNISRCAILKQMGIYRDALAEAINGIDLRTIDATVDSFRPEMRHVLADYANTYLRLYSWHQTSSLSQEVATRVKWFKERNEMPMAKTGSVLGRTELLPHEQQYMSRIFNFVDIANSYLVQEQLDSLILASLKEVMQHFCYGKKL